MSDLKPCPCCGGKARLVKKEGFGPAGGKFSRGYVRCDKCEITTPTKSPWEKAVTAWNRRVATALEKENAELRKALEPFAEPHSFGDHYVKFSPDLISAARAALRRARLASTERTEGK